MAMREVGRDENSFERPEATGPERRRMRVYRLGMISAFSSDKQLDKSQGHIMVAVEHSKYDQHLE